MQASSGARAVAPAIARFVAPETSLFLDVDGTLLEIADHPDAVLVDSDLRTLLLRLERLLGGALALVSGRTIAVLDELFRPASFSAAGAHGAELRLEPSGPVLRSAPQLEPALRRDLVALTGLTRGLLAEDKGVSVALHYRHAPDFGASLQRAIDIVLAHHGARVAVLAGKCVFEVKAAGIDKGGAIRSLMAREPFIGRRPIFIGDDITDEPGFHAARTAGGLAISVGQPHPDAALLLDDPAAVRGFLAELAASWDAAPADTKVT